MLEPIVVDYKTSLPVARDAEVLRFFEVVIDKLEVRGTPPPVGHEGFG